ncbi:MAG: class I SAM-dependent methyltransferase [Lachnospiraceae bacterium]|nr:class I SAM-dependent methyltransferase [Lachnospiraceae bacterium]
MIRSYLSDLELEQYSTRQVSYLANSILELDSSWKHYEVIKRWCNDAIQQIEQLKMCEEKIAFERNSIPLEMKTEKYTHWVETMRLAFFQYSRFTEKKYARSEALYSTLCSLAMTWDHGKAGDIVVPGCGPGRSVLDLARLYPSANVIGLDYSLLALVLGNQIVCGDEKAYLLQRDIHSGERISGLYTVKGFGLGNANFGITNLISCPIPACDMMICSNTVNLLPDHQNAVNKIADAVRPGGIVVFADLIGWRLDRQWKRRQLYDDASIKNAFEEGGFTTLDMFSGVPYIESESDDQETCYNEHFYVGRRR